MKNFHLPWNNFWLYVDSCSLSTSQIIGQSASLSPSQVKCVLESLFCRKVNLRSCLQPWALWISFTSSRSLYFAPISFPSTLIGLPVLAAKCWCCPTILPCREGSGQVWPRSCFPQSDPCVVGHISYQIPSPDCSVCSREIPGCSKHLPLPRNDGAHCALGDPECSTMFCILPQIRAWIQSCLLGHSH